MYEHYVRETGNAYLSFEIFIFNYMYIIKMLVYILQLVNESVK